MRIALVSNLIPPLWIGGYEIGAARIVQALRSRGHEVLVFSAHELIRQDENLWHHQTHTKPSRQELVDLGPCLMGSLARLALRAPWKLPALILSSLAGRMRLPRCLKDFMPDLILLFNPLGILVPVITDCLSWARRNQVPIKSYVSDNWLADWPRAHPLLRLIPQQFRRSRLPRSDQDIYCSQYLFNASEGRDQDRVVPWGLSEVPSQPLEPGHFDRPGPLRLLYAGQIEPHKGLLTLIEALAACKQPHRLVVLGDETTGHARICQQKAQELGIEDQVILVGRQSPRTMIHLLRQLGQILIVPSIWPEPLSLTLLEGMAAGLTIIASRTGGTPEAIEHEQNGLLFDAQSPDQLTHQIDQLDSDRLLAHGLGQRAWETARDRFTLDAMLDGLLGALLDSTQSSDSKQEFPDADRIQPVAIGR